MQVSIPTKKKEIHVFLSFANCYRRFIINHSAKARPFIDLTNDIPYTCRYAQQQTFDKLLARFLLSPIFTQFNSTL